MVRSLLSPSRSFLTAGLVATVWAFLAPGAANAQGVSRYIPPDAKGFRALMMRQAMIQEAARAAASAAVVSSPLTVHHTVATPPVDVQISINIPGNWNPPASVAIEGPEGDVRTFRVEGGRQALHSTVIVVRPGERVTVQLTPARPRTIR